MIVLSVLSGGCRGQVSSYDHLPVLVGRNPGNDLQLSVEIDLTVSGNHAEIRKDGQGFTLFDLGSSNGTLVNGQKIERVRLKDGDVIQFGLNGPQVQFGLQQAEPTNGFYCAICAAESHEPKIVCPSCTRTLCEIHRIPQYGICNECLARGYQNQPPARAPEAPTPPAIPAAVGRPGKKPMRLPTMGMMLTPDTTRIEGEDGETLPGLPPLHEMPPPPAGPPPVPAAPRMPATPPPMPAAPPPVPAPPPPGRLVHGANKRPPPLPPAQPTGRTRLPSAIREAAVIDDDDEGGFFTEADFRTTLNTPVADDFELRLD